MFVLVLAFVCPVLECNRPFNVYSNLVRHMKVNKNQPLRKHKNGAELNLLVRLTPRLTSAESLCATSQPTSSSTSRTELRAHILGQPDHILGCLPDHNVTRFLFMFSF